MNNATQALDCLSTSNTTASLSNCLSTMIPHFYTAIRATFILFSSAFVFFMQAGFAMVCAGAVRTKNVQNSMLKNLLDACGSAIAFYAFGFAFAYGDGHQFIGGSNFFLIGLNEENYLFWFFQFAFAATSATIVAGALAERCKMTAYFVYAFVLSGFVYPVIVRGGWSYEYGIFRNLWGKGNGVVDFSGSGVVHMTGGFTALIAAKLLGPREGRFCDVRSGLLEVPKKFRGHSVALQVLGTFILWFGWYGFNCGSVLVYSQSPDYISTISLVAVNTTLAAGASCITAVFTQLYITERKTGEVSFDITVAMNSILSGIVSITAGCGVIPIYTSIITGSIAGLVYLSASNLLIRYRIDDVVDAIPIHFFNGMWGLIAAGLFAYPEYLSRAYGMEHHHAGLFFEWARGRSDAYLLCAQILFILFIITWVSLIMTPILCLLSYVGWFRSHTLEEAVGLDVHYHGRMIINDDDDDIPPSYIEALQKSREEKLRKRANRTYLENTDIFDNSTSHDSHGESIMEGTPQV